MDKSIFQKALIAGFFSALTIGAKKIFFLELELLTEKAYIKKSFLKLKIIHMFVYYLL